MTSTTVGIIMGSDSDWPVMRAAAVPVPDERLGEKVCLAVAFRPGLAMDAEDVLAHLDESGLSKFDMPEYFLVMDDLPLTASVKILKRELVRAIADGEVTPQPVRFKERAR